MTTLFSIGLPGWEGGKGGVGVVGAMGFKTKFFKVASVQIGDGLDDLEMTHQLEKGRITKFDKQGTPSCSWLLCPMSKQACPVYDCFSVQRSHCIVKYWANQTRGQNIIHRW